MSTSSNTAVRAERVSKIYRLYDGNRQRLLDLFGLLPERRGYREHRALDNLSVRIERGEKVAIIGRNGAGKSTFMKLVSQVIHPTSGTIEVAGRLHALLQIGTGFHPEFSGRENILAYFAQLGISPAAAAPLVDEVVEFAELEEYIDQPVKTYSTGMAVRLMFSTSTAITPDLLLLDEVLGVGDAYFTQKSFDRIGDLCRSAGTTLLLVTHDLYSAVRLCDRVIWIDRGRLVMDGRGADVVRAYEDAIRLQEEQRLRLRTEAALKRSRSDDDSAGILLVEIRPGGGGFLTAPVSFRRLALHCGQRLVEAPLGADAFSRQGSRLIADASAWGEVATDNGETTRQFLSHGSPYRTVVAAFVASADADEAPLSVALTASCEDGCTLAVAAYADGYSIAAGEVTLPAGGWSTVEVPLQRVDSGAADRPAGLGRHGTGAIVVDDIQIETAAGSHRHLIRHGEPADIVLSYRITDAALQDRALVLIAILRDGVQDVCRLVTENLRFDARAARDGVIRLHLDRVPLANGHYTVTVMIARSGYYAAAPTRYFSVSPDVYCCLTQVLEFAVDGGGAVANGTSVVIDGQWSQVAGLAVPGSIAK